MNVQNTAMTDLLPPKNGLTSLDTVTKRSGLRVPFEESKIVALFEYTVREYLSPGLSISLLVEETKRALFEQISTQDIEKAAILAAATFIERDPLYGKIATRLLQKKLMREIVGAHYDWASYEQRYQRAFSENILKGVALGLLDKRMALYDLHRLSKMLIIERDRLLDYTGMHTLYERYLLKYETNRLETVQAFWMRISMGLALNEQDPHARALEFYEILSTLRYIPSTPTLFHSGFPVAQLSSCYLTTVNDSLDHIFKCLGDNAQLSKWAGGIGTDWTNVRGTGAFIKSIKATSQGVIPYLKIANDVVVAITRSGIRRGGKCAYLETWHSDIEEFLDLRRNTGDERRRTHDMNTAHWIPDLFMKRVESDDAWTLFSPHEVPDLHDLYGKTFERRYESYERAARAGEIPSAREISARTLWKKMLTRLFETGHPWIVFKDACNVRSPQDHAGVIHSSNLCTEITLNTSADETAVCNLGSINLERHTSSNGLDVALLEETAARAVRMLDNVIDLNYYPTKEAENSNKRHRPIGLGLMGFQDALCKQGISFASQAALDFADSSMEHIAYSAIQASSELAQERGAYESFKGSKWDRGIFPSDTLDLLENERGVAIPVDRKSRKDWLPLKKRVQQYGMRNSNVMAIAPTATIATIAGCYPSIEPMYKNIYVKSNVSGEFTVINPYLVNELKELNLWNQELLDKIKFHDGNLASIPALPQEIKDRYQTAFELDPEWLIKITAMRGKWIDQSQSHNVFMQGVSGKKLHDIYTLAWRLGLKSTYYLRTMGASQIEKSTLDAKKFGFTQKRGQAACSLVPGSEECESCQ